jgi:hypothetical protein
MTSAPPRLALGFSTHTGWAQAVAVAAPLSVPKLLHRGRIDLNIGKDSVHVFHVAADMGLPAAQSHIERCATRATANAQTEIASLLDAHARAKAAIGIVVGNTKLPPLEAVLRSHMLIHAAEGEFYRRAIIRGAEAHKLMTVTVPAKELAEAASAALELKPAQLGQWLTEYGRTVGRPWGRDEKDAFLAACVALAS